MVHARRCGTCKFAQQAAHLQLASGLLLLLLLLLLWAMPAGSLVLM
jgi:hypothetical protein